MLFEHNSKRRMNIRKKQRVISDEMGWGFDGMYLPSRDVCQKTQFVVDKNVIEQNMNVVSYTLKLFETV